jgi:hypothetical protein
MRLTCFISALFCALVQFATPVRAQQTAQKPITLAAIVEAMETRQKRAASVSVRWNQNERYRGGDYEFPCEMLLKGDSMRYVSKTYMHNGGSVSLIDPVSTWDGKESRFLQGMQPPAGRILSEKGNRDARTTLLVPLMLYFRPLVTLDTKALALADGRKTIDGRQCVTIDDGEMRVDLDRGREFIPVAFEVYLEDGRVYSGGTLEYYRNRDARTWVPKSFQLKTPSRQSIRGSNVQTAMAALLKESEFVLTFEPGTIVWDARTQEEYRVGADGSKELIGRPRRRKPLPKVPPAQPTPKD